MVIATDVKLERTGRTNMETETAALLADVIKDELTGTVLGHCARVDFLARDEALVVCHALQECLVGDIDQVTIRVLTSQAREGELFITTDEAIEIRNRKETRLCLFVPSDTVDAAYSSLTNSFAPLDARELYAAALHRLQASLPEAARRVVRDVRRAVRPPLHIGDDQILDFASILLNLAHRDALDEIGLQLWRVGLIADARPEATTNLDPNRRATMQLTRPAKLTATPRERVATLGVDTATTDQLLAFFAGRAIYDVRAWSRALAEGRGPTFDQWGFLNVPGSDVRLVTIRPFTNADGAVERYTKLHVRAPCSGVWRTRLRTPRNGRASGGATSPMILVAVMPGCSALTVTSVPASRRARA